MLRAPVLGLRAGDLAAVGALMAIITQHAAMRYVERVAPTLTIEQARAVLTRSMPAIDRAIAFGASGIRLPCGARLVLRDDMVVTVRNKMSLQVSATMFKRWRRNAREARRA